MKIWGASKRNRRRTLLFAAFGLLTILTVMGAAIFSWLGGVLLSQQAAARFAGGSGERFSQVSVFFPASQSIAEDDVFSFRFELDKKLVAASLEATEEGSLYTDAYSAEGTMTVTGPRGNATAPVLGVGGDYFVFHPLELISGTYISGDDLMHDRVVLDEALAWKLFGGTDVAGLEVLIGGEPWPVAGVVRREEDFATQKAYSGDGALYMAFDRLSAEQKVQTYEIVCVDPISGFISGIVEERFKDCAVVESTGRYGVESIFGVIKDFGTRSMNTVGVIYPYWENAARFVEDYAALTLLLTLLCALFPAVLTLVFIVICIRHGWRRLRTGLPALHDRHQTRRYERRLLKRAKEGDGEA